MVLVDTSVWVSHFRKGERRLEMLLEEAEVLIHPFIIGELACGNIKNRREILSLLHALPIITAVSQEEILYFIEQKALVGSGMSFIDVHLLAAAQLKGVPIWTFDNTLDRTAAKLQLSYGKNF
jgi:predicted nucleic acid-binding protein